MGGQPGPLQTHVQGSHLTGEVGALPTRGSWLVVTAAEPERVCDPLILRSSRWCQAGSAKPELGCQLPRGSLGLPSPGKKIHFLSLLDLESLTLF